MKYCLFQENPLPRYNHRDPYRNRLLIGVCFSATVGECGDWAVRSRQKGWELPRKQGQPDSGLSVRPGRAARDLADAVPRRKSSRDRGSDRSAGTHRPVERIMPSCAIPHQPGPSWLWLQASTGTAAGGLRAGLCSQSPQCRRIFSITSV